MQVRDINGLEDWKAHLKVLASAPCENAKTVAATAAKIPFRKCMMYSLPGFSFRLDRPVRAAPSSRRWFMELVPFFTWRRWYSAPGPQTSGLRGARGPL